jgi:HPt (histidine-containing phosphotransfer) domain-containing protein
MGGVDIDLLLVGVPLHDRADLLERMSGDEEIAAEVMEVFFEDLPSQLVELSRSLGAGDMALVKRQAHTVKGASGNVGATSMRLVAYEVEKAAAAGDLIDARFYAKRLVAEFDRLKSYFDR